MHTFYLVCFVLGFVLSLLAAFGGLGRVHFGHMHLGQAHVHGGARGGNHIEALNGFTLPAFLCWFGGTGYLLERYSGLLAPIALFLAVISGLVGAAILYWVLFKLLLPRERVMLEEETRMDGVVARVAGEIRAGGTGEILFSQADARRSAAARSETGEAIARGTEVVVLRYVRGIAYVSPMEQLMEKSGRSTLTL
ncbi:MAG TPA: hypothetical protein VGU46_12540 [Acidobacteriaceae bacterium]|nr:hypothetical protein [Acidobacteriaceae bacterium]